MFSFEDWEVVGCCFDFCGFCVFLCVGGLVGVLLLLLIYGFLMVSWDWCKFWLELVGMYWLVVVDMLGLGFLVKLCGYCYMVSEQVDFFFVVLVEVGVVKCVVLVYDLGDIVVQELIVCVLDGWLLVMLCGVILFNGGLFFEMYWLVLMQKLLLLLLGLLVVCLFSCVWLGVNLIVIVGDVKFMVVELDVMWQLMSCDGGLVVLLGLICYIVEWWEQCECWVGVLQCCFVLLIVIDGSVDFIFGVYMVVWLCELVICVDIVELFCVGYYLQIEVLLVVLIVVCYVLVKMFV